MNGTLKGHAVLYRTTAADRADTLEDAGAILPGIVVEDFVDEAVTIQVFLRRAPGSVLRTEVPKDNTTAQGTWWPVARP